MERKLVEYLYTKINSASLSIKSYHICIKTSVGLHVGEFVYWSVCVCVYLCVCVFICLFVCICIWTCQNCSLSAPLSRFDQSISPGYDNRASVTSKPHERQLYHMNIKSVLVWLLLHLYFPTTKRDLIGGLGAAAVHCNSLTIRIMDIEI